MNKSIKVALFIVFISIVAGSGYFTFNYLFQKLVLFPEIKINVSGTGSMSPTFPRGKGSTVEEKEAEVVASPIMIRYPNGFVFNNKSYYRSQLEHGSIISFYYKDKALIKRIIGTPGDIVEIRNGLVYLNDTPLKEPYTASPHSTFGGKSIAECQKIKIPENKYLVLGDNRKESDDSRFDVGLVDISSIDSFLPINRQTGVWDKNWRNTDKDLDESSKIKLDITEFVSKINSLRKQQGIKLLEPKVQLDKSALLRANNIFATGSFDEKANGNLSIAESIKQAGYWEPVYGEIPIQGYFDSQELFNYINEFANTRNFVLDKDFDEIGITVKEDLLNNCPTQLIVIHFAGYVPPNYDNATVKSWSELRDKLRDILPGWEKAKTYGIFYDEHKRDIDKVISIIKDRIDYLSPIVEKMKKNEWLTSEELDILANDEKLGAEQSDLAGKLNNL